MSRAPAGTVALFNFNKALLLVRPREFYERNFNYILCKVFIIEKDRNIPFKRNELHYIGLTAKQSVF